MAEHLEAHGLRIIERNVEIGGAELDIVACEDSDDGPSGYVFVEVRSRASSRLGSPLETVGRDKQRRIVRGATAWLMAHGLWERVEVRFDVVAVDIADGGGPQWIRGAFEVDG
ncbi:MAG: YraN family protein [Deltaproteobacteria bacterium]|nr:YraN family protein [Deltaproteobacteria bacterium]